MVTNILKGNPAIPLVCNSLPRFFGEGLVVSRLQRSINQIMSSEDKAGTKGMIYILIEMDYKLQTQNHKPLVANEGELIPLHVQNL